MIPDLVDELRLRLRLDDQLWPDAQLQHFIDVAASTVSPWLAADAPAVWPDLVDEATVQLAVKMVDVSGRGAVTVDPVGEFMVPAPAATPGMIRSVFGVLGPAMATGGVSV